VEARVLITSHDLELAVSLRRAFGEAGIPAEVLGTRERLEDAGSEAGLLILTADPRGGRGRALLEEAAERGGPPVLGISSDGTLPDRATCRRLGVAECFPRAAVPDELVLISRRLLQRARLREITGIVGSTEAMEEALERVVQIAPVDSTVLIQGESGTGKELVARGIHALSPRRHRPFIAVNVAALPETLLESELFGHEKGAFTGASGLRKGLFELAHGGTIFLDEIGEMPPGTQTKLLRVLEEREFRRVGGEESIRVNVRVVAATNRELRREVLEGGFRRDLYHRLNVLRIDLPPLRERRADIPLLIRDFIAELSEEHDRPPLELEPEALRILMDYGWPGNVRELRNLVESMVVLAPGRTIRAADIPPEIRGGSSSFLPVPVPRRREEEQGRGGGPSPKELEFIFRTLVEMKIDMEELRREFEAYRDREEMGGVLPISGSPIPHLAAPRTYDPVPREVPEPTAHAEGAPSGDEERRTDQEAEDMEGAVVFRPGMTMEEMEREAIRAALEQVAGNRRRAAEMLGIGERTLYRKLKEYDLEV
jgi:DNA-binding NtrC family response regulator